MRLLFWVILFVNVAFFGWQYPKKESRIVDATQTPQVISGNDLETITLLSEETVPRSSPAMQQEVKEAPQPLGEAGACFTIGSFTSRDQAKKVLTRVERHGLLGDIRTIEQSERNGYWVLLPPLANRKLAKEILRDMHKANVDSFIVTTGQKSNAISVGIFNSESHAKRRVKDLRGKGFNVVMEERLRTKSLYWVDFHIANGEVVGENFEKQVLASVSAVRLESRSCETSKR